MKLVTALLLLSWCSVGMSQLRRVLDQNTHLPVAFATVKVMNTNKGTITSESGEFALHLTEADSLLISCVGYQTRVLAAREVTGVVYLRRKPTELEQVIVSRAEPARSVRLGYSGPIPKQFIRWGPSDNKEEFAQKIDLPNANNTYRLKKLQLPVRTYDCETTLLLYVYLPEVTSGLPGEAIFVQPIKAGKRNGRKKNLVIDLSPENIYISNTGYFYISLGWAPGAAKGCAATILMRTSADSSTFSRTLTNPTFRWFLFGQRQKDDEKRWNTMYAVDADELR